LWTDELLINCARAAVPDGTTILCADAAAKLRRVRKAREQAVEIGKHRFEEVFILQVVQIGH
jgi:tRNA U34 5-methylaminomethyl-2-thiouridine-forming methyltransferase MnmC